jgi:hypothetical protein
MVPRAALPLNSGGDCSSDVHAVGESGVNSRNNSRPYDFIILGPRCQARHGSPDIAR